MFKYIRNADNGYINPVRVLRKLPKLKEIIDGVADQKDMSKEVMYKTYYSYLMAVVMRYINNRSDSEEIVNDTFIKIFNHITQFQLLESAIDPEKTFKAWMAKIASRNCIDYLRKRKIINGDFDDVEEEKYPQIYSRALDQLYVEDILKLLNTLPESQRIIFNMFEIEGFSHEEISKSLNIPENICRVKTKALTQCTNNQQLTARNTQRSKITGCSEWPWLPTLVIQRKWDLQSKP